MIRSPGGLTMRLQPALLALGALGVAAVLRGDDLTGKDRLLCTAVHVMQCTSDGECQNTTPQQLNLPEFVEVDLKARMVSTTKASGENRTSPIGNVTREGGLIVFQGVQTGRAFSFVIGESGGLASVSVAGEDMTVSIFGACTPLPDGK
jgi:hypothetical protein